MSKIGLTLGKYAPFHLGHKLVIDTALSEMDKVIVLVYEDDITPIPVPVRANWIRALYPSVEVIECYNCLQVVGYTLEIMQAHEKYILNTVGNRRITHFYSSEDYGVHVSKALNATDRRVDQSRATFRISATEIRSDPYKHRAFIPSNVYRDLIIKVVFLGAMSTGKSTITEALAKRHNTTFASEYGRDYWDEHQINRRLSFQAFNEIAVGHIKREEAAFLSANQYCFIDTNAITTYMFALDYHGTAPKLLTHLAIENASRYDLFFLCEDDIPYDDTWDRSGDQKRHIFHKRIVADLEIRRIPYISLKGDLETRMNRVDGVLSKFQPYSNFYGG